ncbi:MAG: serine hydrolase domain-containing protein [Saprospiraceae bacterium]
MDSICKSFIEKGNTVGLSIGISRYGRTLFAKGYGLANIKSNKAATDSTIYPVASISKFMTAIVAMKMVEEGKISLSDRIVDHIKEFPRREYMDEITIEHLLRHQSGLADHEDWMDSIYINERRVMTDQSCIVWTSRCFSGRAASYSNSGYATFNYFTKADKII